MFWHQNLQEKEKYKSWKRNKPLQNQTKQNHTKQEKKQTLSINHPDYHFARDYHFAWQVLMSWLTPTVYQMKIKTSRYDSHVVMHGNIVTLPNSITMVTALDQEYVQITITSRIYT